jgi:hypothetical protein
MDNMENEQLTPLEARRLEVAQYQQNIAMFTAIAGGLPTEWPARLEKYRGAKNKHEVVDEVEDMADVQLLSQLWYADECHKAIRSETVEMTKAAAILAVLEAAE